MPSQRGETICSKSLGIIFVVFEKWASNETTTQIGIFPKCNSLGCSACCWPLALLDGTWLYFLIIPTPSYKSSASISIPMPRSIRNKIGTPYMPNAQWKSVMVSCFKRVIGFVICDSSCGCCWGISSAHNVFDLLTSSTIWGLRWQVIQKSALLPGRKRVVGKEEIFVDSFCSRKSTWQMQKSKTQIGRRETIWFHSLLTKYNQRNRS